MPIAWIGYQQFVSRQIAAVRSSSRVPIDASVGSVTLALAQAVSGVALWLQAEVTQALTLTRASTSAGPDLDTWLSDWGIRRTPAVPSTGHVTLSRFTASASVVVPVGARVSTGPGGPQFAILADESSPFFRFDTRDYLLPSGIFSIEVPIVAVTSGDAGNVLAGSVTSFVTPIIGIDTVENLAPFGGGSAPASDAAARQLFRDYIAGLNRGTPAAVLYAARTVAPSAVFSVVENTDVSGAYRPGWFVVVVDDGSGAPPASLLESVAKAVEQYRAIGTFPAVRPPDVESVVISMVITVALGVVESSVRAAVVQAVGDHVNGLPVGVGLDYLRVAQVAFDSSPYVTNINNLLINGSSASVGVGQFGVVKASSIAVAIAP
jgi:hypothetical protein